MKECCGNEYIFNGELQPVGLFDNSLVYKGESVYEVIRLIKGVPVFFNDHMERLSASVQLQHKKQLASIEELRKKIILLSGSWKKKETNIKIVFNYNEGNENYLIYFIDSAYPSGNDYIKGVKGILYYAERKDPSSKVINYRLKSLVHQELISEGAYEALLVNENNQITEGSRSNIFFLKNDRLITAPDDVILKGITRKHILSICQENQIDVEFACVDAENISGYDAVFMTGTSPMILPFSCINETYFNVRLPLMGRLREIYMKKVDQSIEIFKRDS